MITKVVHGWRPAGLLAYLLGPGRSEVHRSPRVIASWDGLDARWQPERTGPGEYDLRLGPLADALHAPVLAAGLPTRAPADGAGRGHVWHCSARLAAGDRVLSDGEWAEIARELLDAAGISVRGDAGGPRWVAIRHADDHIHIVAVLVRQDTARRFWPHHDFPKLRTAAREIERRLGLTVTAGPDRTAAPCPRRGELEKAARQAWPPARVELRRAVRRAAIRAGGSEEFLAQLRQAGYVIELRYAPSGEAIGYKIARAGDVGATGQLIFYSGSKLAPDLSLPQLLRRWAQAGRDGSPAAAPGDVVGRAREALGSGDEPADGIIHATSDLLTALGARPGPSGERWARAAEVYDRAARPPGGRCPDVGPVGGELRLLARRLLLVRGVAVRHAVGSAVFAVAMVALLQEIAAWQRHRGRTQQSTAAAAAASCVRDGTGRALAGRVRAVVRGNERERTTARSPGP